MSDGIKSARFAAPTLIVWASCIVVVAGVGWAETILYPRSHRVYVPFLVAGVGCIILGHYARHRWGGWALTATCLFAIAACTLSLRAVFLDVLDIGYSLHHPLRLPTVLALSNSISALAPVGILVQRSARRPRPLLSWDLPSGLMVCALGEVVGFALNVAYMVVTTAPVG